MSDPASAGPAERVSSDLRSPLIATLYVLLLPIWGLLLIMQLSSPAPRTELLVIYGVLVVLSAIQLPVGLGLGRQRVEADAAGVRLLGPIGFTAAWADVESLRHTPHRAAANVAVTMREGSRMRAASMILRTRVRHIGVQPEQVEPLFALAAAHGVTTT
jgi:hypothetical protein